MLHILDQAGMTIADIVKVTQYFTRPEDIPAYAKVRARVLGDARPAFMLLVVSQLVRPEFLLEVEIIAAKAELAKRENRPPTLETQSKAEPNHHCVNNSAEPHGEKRLSRVINSAPKPALLETPSLGDSSSLRTP